MKQQSTIWLTISLLVLILIGIGVLLYYEIDDREDDYDDMTVQLPFSLAQAEAIALGAVAGTITESGIESEEGRLLYSVEMLDTDVEHEVKIDPYTGAIISIEQEAIEKPSGANVGTAKQPAPTQQSPITEEDARQIAIEIVPGRITDVEIERKFGKQCYVVEIDADRGPETDVIIEIATGKVLGTED